MSNPGNPIIFPIQMRMVQVAPNVNAIGNRLSQVFPEFEAKIRSLRDFVDSLEAGLALNVINYKIRSSISKKDRDFQKTVNRFQKCPRFLEKVYHILKRFTIFKTISAIFYIYQSAVFFQKVQNFKNVIF